MARVLLQVIASKHEVVDEVLTAAMPRVVLGEHWQLRMRRDRCQRPGVGNLVVLRTACLPQNPVE